MNTKSWAVATLFGLGIALDGGSRRRRRGAEGRRQGPRLHAQGLRRQDLQPGRLQGQEGRRDRLVPQGVHRRLHGRVQVVPGQQRHAQGDQRGLLHRQRRSRRGRQGQRGVRQVAGPRLPDPQRPGEDDRQGLRRAQPGRHVADRWTFYIDKEGIIKEIDKKTGTDKAGEDVVAKIKSWASAAEPFDRRFQPPGGPSGPPGPSQARLSCSNQRDFSSPRIRQNSRLCIRPGTRPHSSARNESGSVYSRWWATSWRKVSNSSSSGRRPSVPVVRVDPDEPPRLVIAAQDPVRGPGVDVDREVDLAGVDQGEPAPEQRPERRDRRLEESARAAPPRSAPGLVEATDSTTSRPPTLPGLLGQVGEVELAGVDELSAAVGVDQPVALGHATHLVRRPRETSKVGYHTIPPARSVTLRRPSPRHS